MAASGDRKIHAFKSLGEVSPVSPLSTTHFQRGAASPLPINSPVEWYAILAELNRRQPLEWLSDDRWSEAPADTETFLTRWGKAVQNSDGSSLDLFGVHPLAPAARVGWWGLALLHPRRRCDCSDCIAPRRSGADRPLSLPIGAPHGAALSYLQRCGHDDPS